MRELLAGWLGLFIFIMLGLTVLWFIPVVIERWIGLFA